MSYPKFMTVINKICGYIAGCTVLAASFLAVTESILTIESRGVPLSLLS